MIPPASSDTRTHSCAAQALGRPRHMHTGSCGGLGPGLAPRGARCLDTCSLWTSKAAASPWLSPKGLEMRVGQAGRGPSASYSPT